MEMKQMTEYLAGQEQMMSDRKADQERMERQIGSLVYITEANRKTNRDEMKQEIMEEQFSSLAAKLNGWRKEIQADHEVIQETRNRRTFRKRCWKGPEYNNGIRD
jgi:Fe2+ transport system protein B